MFVLNNRTSPNLEKTTRSREILRIGRLKVPCCDRYPDLLLVRCSNLLKILYAIINLFIKQKLHDSIVGALFHSPMFLCNIRSPQVFKNFYDVIVFPSSDFTLVLGVELKGTGWPDSIFSFISTTRLSDPELKFN